MERRGLREQSTVALLLLNDVVWGGLAYVLAFLVRIYLPVPFTSNFLPAFRVFELHHMLPQILVAEVAILYFFGFYDLRALRGGFRPIITSVTALLVHLMATTSMYFFAGDLFFPRSVLVLYWLINAVGLAASREWLSRRLAASSPVRVFLVGRGDEVTQFLGGVGEPRLHHVEIVGAVALGDDGAYPRVPGDPPLLGGVADLPRLLEEYDVDDIVLLSPLSWRDRLVDQLLRQGRRPRVSVVPSIYDILVGRVSTGRIHDVPLVEVVKDPHDDLAYLVKRATELLIALVLATFTFPVLLVSAMLIKLTSRGPVFYRQPRVGRGQVEFMLWKLRTMRVDAEGASGEILATLDDRRVTRIGRLLRATRVDELPQLWNIVNGTMSLVGPRPERPGFVRTYAEEIPGYLERFQVRPGLTGLAQVNGEYHTSATYKLKYDLAYIYNHSLMLDLKIMAETIKVMVTRRGI